MFGRNGNGSDLDQTLNLIERSNPSQQAEIIELITKTDPAKAALLRARMLSVARILSLDDETLGRILEDIDDKAFGLSLKDIDLELRKRALTLVNNEKRKVALDLIKRNDAPDVEIEAARRNLILKTRELEKAGRIHLGVLAPQPHARHSGQPKKKAA